jgi:hypothetical protein
MNTVFLRNPPRSFHITATTMTRTITITLVAFFLTLTGSNGEEESPGELHFRPRPSRPGQRNQPSSRARSAPSRARSGQRTQPQSRALPGLGQPVLPSPATAAPVNAPETIIDFVVGNPNLTSLTFTVPTPDGHCSTNDDGIKCHGPVHEVQAEMVESQITQGSAKSLSHVLVPSMKGTRELAHDKEILACDDMVSHRVLEGVSDDVFVAIDGCSIDYRCVDNPPTRPIESLPAQCH